jgi:glycosyltransferase involved in cell wall biosynthesis
VPVTAADTLLPLAGGFDLACLPDLDPLPFALPVHECAALGVPCLVGDAGAQAEAVRHYRCGEALPAGDVAAWAEAIERLASARDRPPLPEGPVPLRLEEEAFLYDSLYRALAATARS